jgi:hypothetical protein
VGETTLFSGITGTTWDELKTADPAAARVIDSLVRSGGAHLLFVGLLSLAISLAHHDGRDRGGPGSTGA